MLIVFNKLKNSWLLAPQHQLRAASWQHAEQEKLVNRVSKKHRFYTASIECLLPTPADSIVSCTGWITTIAMTNDHLSNPLLTTRIILWPLVSNDQWTTQKIICVSETKKWSIYSQTLSCFDHVAVDLMHQACSQAQQRLAWGGACHCACKRLKTRSTAKPFIRATLPALW